MRFEQRNLWVVKECRRPTGSPAVNSADMSVSQDGHYVQAGPGTELLRWRRMGRCGILPHISSCTGSALREVPFGGRRPALCRRGALLRCETARFPPVAELARFLLRKARRCTSVSADL